MQAADTWSDPTAKLQDAYALTVVEQVKREVAELRALQISRFEDRAALLIFMEQSTGVLQAQIERQAAKIAELQERLSEVESNFDAAELKEQRGRLDRFGVQLEEQARWSDVVRRIYDAYPIAFIRRFSRIFRRPSG